MKQKTGEAGEREKGKGRQERGRGCFHTIDLSRKHDSVIPHTDGYTPHSSSCYSFAATSCLQPGLHRRVWRLLKINLTMSLISWTYPEASHCSQNEIQTVSLCARPYIAGILPGCDLTSHHVPRCPLSLSHTSSSTVSVPQVHFCLRSLYLLFSLPGMLFPLIFIWPGFFSLKSA